MGYSSTIKNKIGQCIDCPPGTPDQPIISDRCNTHYWQYRRRMKPKKEPKKRVQIKKVSTKREKENLIYKILREQFLKDNPICQGKLYGCTTKATECHHKAGRGANMLNTTTWAALCNNCHTWCTENSKEAIELGLSERRNVSL